MKQQPQSSNILLTLKYQPKINIIPNQTIKLQQHQLKSKPTLRHRASKPKKVIKNYQLSTFQLPTNMEDYKYLKTRTDLQYLLKKQFEKAEKLQQYNYHVFTCKNEQFLYAKCRKCSSCLRYKWRSNTFQLHLFKNLHEHEGRKKGVIYSIVNELKNHPQEVDRKQLKEKMMKRFSASKGAYYYALKLFQQTSKDGFQAILHQLQQKGQIYYQFDYSKNNPSPFPSTLLIITKSMKQYYNKYGECVKLDLIQNVIKSQSKLVDGQLKNVDYTIGILSGSKSGDTFIIFGIVVINADNANVYHDCFKKFIKSVGKSPKSIITQKKTSIMIALQQLKNEGLFEGQHVWNPIHIWRSYNFRNTTIKDILKDMISAQSKQQYQRLMNKALTFANSADERQKIQTFHDSSKNYCLSQIDCFVGYGMLKVTTLKVQNFITSKFTYPKQYSLIIPKLVALCDTRNIQKQSFVKQNSVVDKILGMPIIQQWRNHLSKFIFRVLIRKYICIIQLQIQEIAQTEYMIKKEQDIYLVMYMNKKWKCSCDYEKKTKMICEHIIKVLKLKNKPILDEIDDYWKETTLDQKNRANLESQQSEYG